MSTGAFLHRAGPALLVGLLGFVLTVDIRVQQDVEASSVARRAELARVVRARQARTISLERTVADLRARLERIGARSSSEQLHALSDRVAALNRVSGSTPVSGPALVVTLADAPEAELEDADFRVQDLDLQIVVNELWAVGAEAIAISGQRLIATSAIRNAGEAVLVNYRVLTSPYRITAVGDADLMQERFTTSATAKRFGRWHDIYGLGFTTTTVREAALPSFEGSIGLRYAEPVRAG